MNQKGYGRKRLWHNLLFQQLPGRTEENSDSRFEPETSGIRNRPRRSVHLCVDRLVLVVTPLHVSQALLLRSHPILISASCIWQTQRKHGDLNKCPSGPSPALSSIKNCVRLLEESGEEMTCHSSTLIPAL
jgi:hypothetical protein